MLNEHGYPDEKDLKEIANWNVLENGVEGLLQLVFDNTNYADASILRDGNKYEYHTYGWSGNEDVIQALRENFMFWGLFWESSYRGGHYKFDHLNMFIDLNGGKKNEEK